MFIHSLINSLISLCHRNLISGVVMRTTEEIEFIFLWSGGGAGQTIASKPISKKISESVKSCGDAKPGWSDVVSGDGAGLPT